MGTHSDLPDINKARCEIAKAIEDHHILFRTFWDYGRFQFDSKHSTAWVEFDADTGFVTFNFNPTFYTSIDAETRAFVAAHELLHIIFGHSKIKKPEVSQANLNIALDIVINHYLTSFLGFNRDKVLNWNKYCWVDTVFPNMDIPATESWEYYLELLEKNATQPNVELVDNHTQMQDDESNSVQTTLEKIIKTESLTEEEIKTLLHENSKEAKKLLAEAGIGTGIFKHIKLQARKQKSKWETIIKKWEMHKRTTEETSLERWDRKHRRFHDILEGRSCFLPTDVTIEEATFKPKQTTVFFFLDTSGSCYSLKDRFFSAARSLDPKKFKIRLFSFDTNVEELNINQGRIYGGGGTRFDIIESKIQSIMKQSNQKYPTSVWIITDGYGTSVSPKHPEKWHWFLTQGNTRNYIPKESKIYLLNDYE